jgi:hypothetical protein
VNTSRLSSVGIADVEVEVGLQLVKFASSGSWSFFLCPQCGRRARTLKLFGGRPACGQCVRAAGMQYRIDMCSHFSKRVALTAPKRIERLNSDTPACLHPRPGRRLDRRANIGLALKRSLLVACRATIAQFEKDLGET